MSSPIRTAQQVQALATQIYASFVQAAKEQRTFRMPEKGVAVDDITMGSPSLTAEAIAFLQAEQLTGDGKRKTYDADDDSYVSTTCQEYTVDLKGLHQS